MFAAVHRETPRQAGVSFRTWSAEVARSGFVQETDAGFWKKPNLLFVASEYENSGVWLSAQREGGTVAESSWQLCS